MIAKRIKEIDPLSSYTERALNPRGRCAARTRSRCLDCGGMLFVGRCIVCHPLAEVLGEDLIGDLAARLPSEPCAAPPGTVEKINVMRHRAERGEQVFHPWDGR